MLWKAKNFIFDTRMPVIMGILNVTPDSFSDGGEHNGVEEAIGWAYKLIQAGAHIIDVGGESTRPGAAVVSVEEELARTIEVVKALAAEGICVSIDTRHAEVAQAALESGAAIINDISGFRDPAMRALAASSDCGCVLMHMKGEPATMQSMCDYDDVVAEVAQYLRSQAEVLEDAGVAHERICIDPGPGFAKTAEQTRDIVLNFQEFARLGYPVMVAVSRKSYIKHYFGIEDAKERDEISAQEALSAVERGACVVRTHNVDETIKALKDLRPYCLIALGSNTALVGSDEESRQAKIDQINLAISDICKLPDTELIDMSSYWCSEPAYVIDQDEFVNACVLIRTGIAPHELLRYLMMIEQKLGRVRSQKYGPRTIDLDILDYQNYTCNDEELVLPHPLIAERDFVLKPLLEIMPAHVLSSGMDLTFAPGGLGKAWRMGTHN